MARLRLVKHHRRPQVLDGAHVGLHQPPHPIGSRPRGEDAMDLALDQVALVRRQGRPNVDAIGARRDLVGEAQHFHEASERAHGGGVNANVLTVSAKERPSDQPRGAAITCGRRARRPRLQLHGRVGLAPDHRVKGERPIDERRLHMTSDAILQSAIERPKDADHGKLGRAGARERDSLENWRLAMPGLLCHLADQRMHQWLIRRQIIAGIVTTKAGYRTVDQPGIELVELIVSEAQRRRFTRPPSLDKDITSFDELEDGITIGGGVQVQDNTPLAPIENGGRAGLPPTRRIAARRLDPSDLGPVVCEESGRLWARAPERAIHHPQSFKGSNHSRLLQRSGDGFLASLRPSGRGLCGNRILILSWQPGSG